MKKSGLWFINFLCFLVAGNVLAHVQLDYPRGGETFSAGETVFIQWHVEISHHQENWDLYFSADGGGTWEAIRLDMNPSQLSYLWTVPQITSEHAQIRIYMDNVNIDYDDTSGDFIIQDTLTSVRERAVHPKTFVLKPCYPNPFNPTTTINYRLSNTGHVKLTIYDQIGRVVRRLINERQSPQNYQIQWDGQDNNGNPSASGIYIYRLKVDAESQTRKMVLLN